jgi:PAS domain S-box-containing protein
MDFRPEKTGFGLPSSAAAETGERDPDSRFRRMLDALPFAIYAINATGFITYCNDTAVALWGRTPPLSGKKRWSGAWRLYHQDGSPLQHEDCAAARALRAGEGTGNEHDRNDDTTALHLTAIVQNSDDAIISKDLNGIIQSWNNGAQRIFGYSAEEIVGKSILTIVPHERHGEEDYILRHLRNGERIDHFETVRRHKDGTLIDISLTVSPVRNAHGIVVGASKIARDVTDRKNAEKRLQRQALHLAALNRAANIISRDLDLGRVVHTVTSIATELSQAEFGALYQTAFTGGRETYCLAALSDGDHNNLDEAALAQNQAVFEAVFNSARHCSRGHTQHRRSCNRHAALHNTGRVLACRQRVGGSGSFLLWRDAGRVIFRPQPDRYVLRRCGSPDRRSGRTGCNGDRQCTPAQSKPDGNRAAPPCRRGERTTRP